MINWTEVYKLHGQGKSIREMADTYGMTREAFRKQFYKWRRLNGLSSNSVQVNQFTAESKAKFDLKEVLKVPKTIDEIAEATGLTKRMVQVGIEELQEQGINVQQIDGAYSIHLQVERKDNVTNEKWDGSEIITFGVVSDTHMGSTYEQLTFLNEAYDIFKARGVRNVYHAGDISEGDYSNRQGHIYERHKHGVDQQADYIIKHYPRRDGIQTQFICGNHDYTHMRNGGADIGVMIARQRDDMTFLGWDNAKVNLTPNCTLELNHPGDGSQYSISYSIQKYIESISGGDKPSILFQGHHHKAMYLFTRNIHAFEAGCTQAQSGWMRSKRLAAHVGAYIVTVEVTADGTIKRIVPEFIPQYVHKEKDYK